MADENDQPLADQLDDAQDAGASGDSADADTGTDDEAGLAGVEEVSAGESDGGADEGGEAEDTADPAAGSPATLTIPPLPTPAEPSEKVKSIKAKLASKEFDMLEHGPEAISALLEENESARNANAAAQAQEQFFHRFATANPGITASRAKEVWDATVSEMTARGMADDVLRGAASIAFENKMKIERARVPARTAVAARTARPATPGRAAITPQRANTRPPAPKPRTVNDRIKSGEYGNIEDFGG